MDYKEKYEQALERARQFSEKPYLEDSAGIVEYIFPELAESEDERIRKDIIHLVTKSHEYGGYALHKEEADKMLAWLEKQGEITKEWSEMKINRIQTELQNMVDLKQKTEQGEQNPYGQRKESGDERTWIINYLSNRELNSSIIAEKENLKKAIAWLQRQGEQKPAYTKEYDFHGIKFIPKFAKGDIIKDKKCGEVSTIEDFSYDTGLYTHTYGQFPITIQNNYEIIEQKSWSNEDELHIRELESLVKQEWAIAERKNDRDKIHKMSDLSFFLKTLKPQLKQEWSEEDEAVLDALTQRLEGEDVHVSPHLAVKCLKSFKNRVQPKQEWSEEDKNRINRLIAYFEDKESFTAEDDIVYANWLKSLRPQSHWKPSDEQIKGIECAIKTLQHQLNVGDKRLNSLYDDLKKLREE